jgi:hypothetical protein
MMQTTVKHFLQSCCESQNLPTPKFYSPLPLNPITIGKRLRLVDRMKRKDRLLRAATAWDSFCVGPSTTRSSLPTLSSLPIHFLSTARFYLLSSAWEHYQATPAIAGTTPWPHPHPLAAGREALLLLRRGCPFSSSGETSYWSCKVLNASIMMLWGEVTPATVITFAMGESWDRSVGVLVYYPKLFFVEILLLFCWIGC